MKQVFFSLIVLFCFAWNSFAFTPPSQYILWGIDLSCYRQSSSWIFESKDGKVLFEVPKGREFLAMQENRPLTTRNLNLHSRFIPFTSNIKQENNTTEEFKNLYKFWDIDTNDTTEIILDFPNYNSLSSRLNFSHSAKFYNTKYYISEDGSNYSLISKNDINDFQIKTLKIVFEPNTQEQVREVIRINTLNIERIHNIIEISWVLKSFPVSVYYNTTCTKRPDLDESNTQLPESLQIHHTNILGTNIYFKKKITDSDKDSIKDLYDNCETLANLDQLDINQNWVWDACEFDADSDGLPDEIDNCRYIPNPEQKDDDNDTIGNACDNCKFYNPSQLDVNNNQIGDTCDQKLEYLQANDDDGDGIENILDNCKESRNPDQTDSDNDGVWDICDNCKVFQNSDQADTNENGVWDICEDSDGDGLQALEDNCPSISNPNQDDSDNDGIWNLCEDDDNDKVLFIHDNCPYLYNANQLDTDNDGMWDVCDEEDNRVLESNKTIFIALMILVILAFMWAIYMTARKIQK